MPNAEAPALRKRQQIQKAGKTMFIWVAVAAAIFGICAVLSVSLFERISFRQEVINKKNDTAATIKKNVAVANQLKDSIRVLNTNQALNATPRLEGTEPVSVILDALPSSANSSALGASLQQKLLTQDGVSVEALTVDPVAGVESDTDDTGDGSEGQITFQFAVSVASGQGKVLQDMLRRLERSIRTINLTSVNIEQQGSKITLTAKGAAYYQPAAKVELKEKSIRP